MVIAAVFLALAGAPAGGDVSPPDRPFERAGCSHGHGYRSAARGLARALGRLQPLTAQDGRDGWHYARCVRDRHTGRRLRQRRIRWLSWRREYGQLWRIRLAGMPVGWVQWARNIAWCESRMDRWASNGTHFSYFQFSGPTWAAASAGLDPRPIYSASYAHQAVIAIRWAWTAGVSQWTCTG